MKSLYAIGTLTTNETLAAGRDLLRLANGKRLHAVVARALGEVKLTHETLDRLRRPRPEVDDPLRASNQAAPMIAVRRSFAALAEVLRGHEALPEGEPLGDKARLASAALFPRGTSFLSGKVVDLDIACGDVLEAARKKDVAAALQELACASHVKASAKVLAELRRSREAFSSTPDEVRDADAPQVTAFEARGAALAALREYARCVLLVAELQGERDGGELARGLLTPLAKLRSARRAEAAHDAAADQAAPEDATVEETEAAPPSRAA